MEDVVSSFVDESYRCEVTTVVGFEILYCPRYTNCLLVIVTRCLRATRLDGLAGEYTS